VLPTKSGGDGDRGHRLLPACRIGLLPVALGKLEEQELYLGVRLLARQREEGVGLSAVMIAHGASGKGFCCLDGLRAKLFDVAKQFIQMLGRSRTIA
jgi:hypothetical protein